MHNDIHYKPAPDLMSSFANAYWPSLVSSWPFQWIVKDCQRVGRWCGKKKIWVMEVSGEWAYHWSKHRNLVAGLIITIFTFLQSNMHTHVYYKQNSVFCCTLCDRELPNSKKQRDLISENTAHLLSAAVQLLCDCDTSGLLSGVTRSPCWKPAKARGMWATCVQVHGLTIPQMACLCSGFTPSLNCHDD